MAPRLRVATYCLKCGNTLSQLTVENPEYGTVHIPIKVTCIVCKDSVVAIAISREDLVREQERKESIT